MTKPLLFLTAILTTHGFAQSDSILVPLEFRFVPSVRTVAAEASTFLFVYGSYGATVDLDLFQLPYATVQGVGLRLNYQEYRKGFILEYHDQQRPLAYISSAFLRASFKKANARSDVFIGISSSDPRASEANNQILFGLDVRTMIVKPLSSIFLRVMGSPSGAAIQFGLAIGYID